MALTKMGLGPLAQVTMVQECLNPPSHLLTETWATAPALVLFLPLSWPGSPEQRAALHTRTFHNRIQPRVCYHLQRLLREPLPLLFIWSGSDVIALTVNAVNRKPVGKEGRPGAGLLRALPLGGEVAFPEVGGGQSPEMSWGSRNAIKMKKPRGLGDHLTLLVPTGALGLVSLP